MSDVLGKYKKLISFCEEHKIDPEKLLPFAQRMKGKALSDFEMLKREWPEFVKRSIESNTGIKADYLEHKKNKISLAKRIKFFVEDENYRWSWCIFHPQVFKDEHIFYDIEKDGKKLSQEEQNELNKKLLNDPKTKWLENPPRPELPDGYKYINFREGIIEQLGPRIISDMEFRSIDHVNNIKQLLKKYKPNIKN